MIGVGIDLVAISSVDLDNTAFLRRFFTENEKAEANQHHDPQSYFAGRFAAKEAAFKAAGNTIPGFNDPSLVEITYGKYGKPEAKFIGSLADQNENIELLVSISNESGLAVAVCAVNYRAKRNL